MQSCLSALVSHVQRSAEGKKGGSIKRKELLSDPRPIKVTYKESFHSVIHQGVERGDL